MIWSLTRLSLFQYGAVAVGLWCLLVLAVGDVAAGRMTVGDLVLLQAYALRLTLPLSGFGFSLSQASVSIANIQDVLGLGGQADTSPVAPTHLIKHPARLRLEDVSFSYGEGLPGLSHVTTEIVAGAFVVIVGRNGSGKSTLAQILAGILEPCEGQVLIHDQAMSQICPDQRHRHILYVPQYIGLFNRSLEANALYPPSTLSRAELSSILTQWRFHDSGSRIDFDRMAGEQGERLSGGQIQKIELARLVGVNAPAIILDESTSALDSNSEAECIAFLRARLGLKTTLILITHERQMAEVADEVLFMEGGRLVGQGGHEDLLRSAKGYRDLWH